MTANNDNHVPADRGELKHCNACGTDHPVEAFPFKNKAAGKRHARCLASQKAHSRANYLADTATARERAAARRKRIATEASDLVDAWLDGKTCTSCGTDRLTAVTTEHGSLKRLVKDGYSVSDIEQLLEQSSTRCRSCGNRE